MSLSPEVYTVRWPLNAWPAVPSTVRGSSVARPPTADGWQRMSGILPALTEDISRWRVDPSPAARCDSPHVLASEALGRPDSAATRCADSHGRWCAAHRGAVARCP